MPRASRRPRHQRLKLVMVLDAPEPLRGAQQAEPDPSPAHVAVTPALDEPGDVPHRPDEILDTVRGREETPEPGRQPELQPRERFVQAFAKTGRRVGVAVPLKPG